MKLYGKAVKIYYLNFRGLLAIHHDHGFHISYRSSHFPCFSWVCRLCVCAYEMWYFRLRIFYLAIVLPWFGHGYVFLIEQTKWHLSIKWNRMTVHQRLLYI